MAARLISFDKDSGLYTYGEKEGRDHMRFTLVHDCQPTVELNKQRQRYYEQHSQRTEFRHVASIPVGVQYKWLHEHGVDIHNKDHAPKVKRLLADPEYRYLRTAPQTRQDFVALRNRSA